MSDMHSLVVIAPDELWATVRALNNALGYEAGEGTPLSADGQEPATHRGLHTWAQPAFVALATGKVTPNVKGYPPEQIAGLLALLTVSVDAEGLTARAHFDHVLGTMGLRTIAFELE